MEGEKILMAAGVTMAAVVGAFVFWGPSESNSRLRQRRGQIAGLYNFGRTCFLNTLLQALAACPQFIAWMHLCNGGCNNRKSLLSSLLHTIEVINGTHSSLRADPYSPGALIRSLSSLGWVIPNEEHDAHELFHILISSLEDEAQSSQEQKSGSLSDALSVNEFKEINRIIGDQLNRPSSAMLTDSFMSDYNESTIPRLARSEAHTPDSQVTVYEPDGQDMRLDMPMPKKDDSAEPFSGAFDSLLTSHFPDTDNKNSFKNYRSLERLTRVSRRVSMLSQEIRPSHVSNPFHGTMANQIICKECGYKSTVRYEKFDSVTLNLPSQKRSGLSLGHLLSEHISSEEMLGVKCESCDKNTYHTKTLTFAKLPACLCIHIARTIWLQTGQVCKQQDYVHFPESLSMAPYSFVQPHLNSQANTPLGSTLSLYSSSPIGQNIGTEGGSFSSTVCGSMFPRNLYRLLAVVVHSGEANTGHFVTYRRGALRNAHRWFYTSDTVVREVTIDEVLSSSAYLLFYDRGMHRQRH